jgi:tripartite-type tricarboxylate transporter receptor subunit TctC
MRRLLFSTAVFFVVFGNLSYMVEAADYPVRPIEFIVPFGAGSSDTYGRLFAAKAQEFLGQPMVVINKPGAGGAIGLIAAARANPDGYTVVLSGTNLAMGRAVNPNVGYDPVNDFAPIARCLTQGVILCVQSSSKITTLAQYIQEARKNPGKITFGSSGIGGSTYFGGMYLKMIAKIDITNVPIREGVMKNLLGGHVESVCVNTPDAVEYVKSGQVRALATTTLQRLPQLPDVPTVAESGYPGFEVVSWIGVTAPKKTPRPITEKLANYFKKTGEDRELQSKLVSLGADSAYLGPDAFGAWIKNEYEKWSKVAVDLNIQEK